jgi:hypothetical protein
MVRIVERERRRVRWVGSVTYETSSGMREEADGEKESQVMRVPECLKALLANFLMRERIHDHHYQEHEVACDATRLGVVNLQSCLWPNF